MSEEDPTAQSPAVDAEAAESEPVEVPQDEVGDAHVEPAEAPQEGAEAAGAEAQTGRRRRGRATNDESTEGETPEAERPIRWYRKSRWIAAVGIGIIVVVVAVVAVVSHNPPAPKDGVGTCWQQFLDGQVKQVDCSNGAAELQAFAAKTNRADCATLTGAYSSIEWTSGHYLCLRQR